MSYTAPNRLLMPMRHSIDTQTDSWFHAENAAVGAGAWPSANRAIYVPVRVPVRVLVRKLWYASTTTATGNVDMGVYDAGGVAVISATGAAKVGGNTEGVFDVTDTTIGPGLYYIAMASDSSTDTFMRYPPAAPIGLAFGVLTEESAYPLPATATWTADQANAFVPVMGLLLEETIT